MSRNRTFPFLDSEFRLSRSRRFLFQRGVPSRGVPYVRTAPLIRVREIPFFRRNVLSRFRKIFRLPPDGGFPPVSRLSRFRRVFLSSYVVLMRARRFLEKAFRRRRKMENAFFRRPVKRRSPRFPVSRDDRPFPGRAFRIRGTSVLFIGFGDGRRNSFFPCVNRGFLGNFRVQEKVRYRFSCQNPHAGLVFRHSRLERSGLAGGIPLSPFTRRRGYFLRSRVVGP